MKTWLPQSDDQFFLWDWSIRHGMEMILDYNTNGIPTINGFSPASMDLHLLVQKLKAAA